MDANNIEWKPVSISSFVVGFEKLLSSSLVADVFFI